MTRKMRFLLLICMVSCLGAKPDKAQNGTVNPFQQDRVPGEYIVTTLGNCEEICLRELTGSFHISQLEKIASQTYRVKLEQDPGLETLSDVLSKSKKIKAVQPNFRYQMN